MWSFVLYIGRRKEKETIEEEEDVYWHRRGVKYPQVFKVVLKICPTGVL